MLIAIPVKMGNIDGLYIDRICYSELLRDDSAFSREAC